MVANRAGRLSMPVALLILAGCTVGPNYKLPAKAIINTPAAQANFVSDDTATQIAEPPNNWWQLYNNPTLDALIKQAFSANTNLRIAQANLESVKAMLAEAKAGREATVSSDATTSYVQQSAESYLQHVQPPERQIYNGGISISYDADLFGTIQRGIEAANDNSEAAAAARDLVMVNVAAETMRAYAEICNGGNELAALRHSVDLQNQALMFERLLYENGRATSFDVAGEQAQLDSMSSQVPLLQAKRINAAYRLSTLIGEPPEEYNHAWLACQQPLVLLTPLPVGDGRSLLNRRPDVREAERRLAAATALVGEEAAKLYPDVKFNASVGSAGAAANILSPLTNFFGFGPSVSWNLNQSVVRASIVQAKAQTRARLAAFDGTVLNALQEAQTAINSYDFELNQMDSLTDSQSLTAQVAASMTELYRGGRVSALAALSANQNLAAANEAVASAQTDVSQSQIAVFYALGGGWDTSGQGAATQMQIIQQPPEPSP